MALRHLTPDRRFAVANTRQLVALVLCVNLAVSGCGGRYDATVGGVVTLDGQSLPRGTVAFHPTAGGPAVYGIISENGRYAMSTGREPGLPSGDYQVSVTANELPAVSKTAQGGPPPPGKPIAPARYASKNTSGLRVTVNPGGNQINLELTTQSLLEKKSPATGRDTGHVGVDNL